MNRRFGWAKELPKPDPEELSQKLSERLQPVQGLPAPAPMIMAPTTGEPAEPAKPKERLLDRRDGRARPAKRHVEGRIRGGKYSGQWGRENSELARGDWVGVRLPPGYNARIKRMAAAHDLYVWQLLTEAVDLFTRLHGETPKPPDEP